MSIAPFIKPIRVAGSFYTFPSTSEDFNYKLAGDTSRKTQISYFALLNLPKMLRPTGTENYMQLDAIPAAYNTVTGSDWNKMLSESFQNYCLNREVMITSTSGYDHSISRTVSERNFWFWLKSIGAIRFREALPSEVSSLSVGKRFVEEDPTTNGYKTVIKYVAPIDIFNSVRHHANSYSEIYLYAPTYCGNSPKILFKSISDVNYEPNMFFTNNPDDPLDREYLLGRHYNDLHPAGLNIEAFYDSDVSSYDDGNLYLLEKKNSADDYEIGWWYPNPMQNTYFTEPITFENPQNDALKITGQGGDKELSVSFLRSRLDGITVDFNLDNYRLATQNTAIKTWIDYNTSAESGSFEYNAVLVYYDVFDESTPTNKTTNLYGILFLDEVEELSVGGGILPVEKKSRHNKITGINGTGISKSINLKFDVSTDDAKIETIINEHSQFSLHLFMNALNELRLAKGELLINNETNVILTRKIAELENAILTVENYKKLENQINKLESNLENSSALIQSTGDITRLVDSLAQEILDIYADRSSVRVAWNMDIIKSGEGIWVDREIPNQLTIRNTKQPYSLPIAPIISILNDWEQDETRWYYTTNLVSGANYIEIKEEDDFIADRNLIFFIDDSFISWVKGQSYKIVFASQYSLDGVNADYSFTVYTDGNNVLENGLPFDKEIAVIRSSEFIACAGKPIIELVCLDSETLNFSVNIQRNYI